MATSAYQVEGAVHEDDRGVSIWDTFSHTPGATLHGDTGDVACDHYQRYEEDVDLAAGMGVGAFRFSIAWSRIQPEGRGEANRRGLDHYRRVIEAVRARGILPVVTMYHWELPQALQDSGGWVARDTAARFGDYAEILGGAFTDLAPMWITLNEPWVAAWLGYGTGEHAPGRKDDAEALAASHHQLLAHGLAVDALRASGAGSVGITLNLGPVHPASDGPDDARAAQLTDAHINRLFLDPLFARGYPPELMQHYAKVSDFGFVNPGDPEVVARPIDFLGVNYYSRHTVSAHPPPEHRSSLFAGNLGTWGVLPAGVATTAMGWGIEPHGLTELLVRLHRDYPRIPIHVTENGAAFHDYVDPEGDVHDPERIAFLRDHLSAAGAAIAAGVDLRGYFAWSLLDNFEWAEGYSKRFGLVYVDYLTGRRIPKDSAAWYGSMIAGNRGAGLTRMDAERSNTPT